ncbi:uracil-xanthine permease family protein [Ammoniphilus sp. YIM 78166]|uniref:uracil-xanthine permease family protein n=1 Tax=Ammoniphilus sp. YIM 78166 TaxID=1644106 RepID=UPI00106F2F5E|nr:solute carrier family 23 protein [Ammoniphilus sp. YIM 78166]
MAKDFIDVHETPPIQKLVPLSLQHLFAMFGATVLVPLITGLDIQAALLSSGLGTLLFIFLTKGLVPNYLGSSFAFIGPIVTVSASEGPGAAMLGCLLAGIVYVIVAIIVSKVGIAWLNRLLPPMVIGSVIIVIGLSLSGVAVNWAIYNPLVQTPEYSVAAVEVAFITLITTVVATIFFKGFLSVIPILTGMITGYVYTLIRFPEWIDLASIANAQWFITPGDMFTNHLLTTQLIGAFGSSSAWFAALVIVPVAFVTLAEHIGHLLVTGRVMDRDLMKEPGLHRTLLGDGLATSLAAFIGGPPNTTYGENIGVLAITRVFSRNVIGLAAVFAIIFAFVGKIGAALMTIPKPVLGGVTIILFGIIAAQGVRMYVEHKVEFADKRNMVIAAIILVTGIGGFKLEIHDITIHNIIANLTIDNIAMATFLGILLHAILPGKETAFGEIEKENKAS